MSPSSKRSTLPAAFILLLTFPFSSSAISVTAETPDDDPVRDQPVAGPPAANLEPLDRQVARELARLDESLGLGTFPDHSELWPARLAAALDRRIGSTCEPSCEAAEEVPGRDLLHRLAIELRWLGTGRGLGKPLERGEGSGPEQPESVRAQRLRRILAISRLIHRKLDLTERSRPTDDVLSSLAAPANDDCSAATAVSIGSFTGSTTEATNDGSASCGASSSSSDVWYRFTATKDNSYVFDTFGSSYDTVLSLYSGCPMPEEIELACNDDAGGTLESRISYPLTTGEEVWIRVSGYGGSTGAYMLNVSAASGLAGTITRQDTGTPLAGVEVEVYGEYGWFVDEAVTREDGTYVVGGLTPDTYYVLARTDDFITELYDGIPCPFYGYCYLSDGTPVEVTSGLTAGIDFVLDPSGVITGSVTDAATADPLDGYIYFYDDTGNYLSSLSTGPGGTYEIGGLAAGTFLVRGEVYEYRSEVYDDIPCTGFCDITAGTSIAVTAGATVTAIDFALDRLGVIEGTVVEVGSGAPLGSVGVIAYDSQGAWTESGWTASDGTYRISSLPPGTWFVRTDAWEYQNELYDDIPCPGSCDVTTGTPVEVSLAATTPGIDFDLYRLGSLTGTVTHAVTGSPISGVYVEAHDSAGRYVRSGRTGPDGAYEIERLSAGTYFVRTDTRDEYLEELYDDLPCPYPCDVTSGAPVAVALETTTSGISFGLDRLGVITGNVTDAETGDPLDTEIQILDAAGNEIAYGYAYGTYEIRGLPLGSRFVKARYNGWPDEYQDELFDDLPCEPSCDLTARTALPITLNQTIVGVDFTLAHCPHESYNDLFGVLILSSYEAEACARVSAFDVTVDSGADVTFRAGRSIVLGDGFVVQAGGSFRAVIDPGWAGR